MANFTFDWLETLSRIAICRSYSPMGILDAAFFWSNFFTKKFAIKKRVLTWNPGYDAVFIALLKPVATRMPTLKNRRLPEFENSPAFVYFTLIPLQNNTLLNSEVKQGRFCNGMTYSRPPWIVLFFWPSTVKKTKKFVLGEAMVASNYVLCLCLCLVLINCIYS